MDDKSMTETAESSAECESSPLVSIVVLAYNHLDYTRQCVESICRYTPPINYELITVDNGSSDGTKEYFEGLPHAKKISFPENIGVCKALNYGFRAAEGKYTMYLSNDIVVTAHWLENLLACMESDPKIGMVVPICDASCNYQQISLPHQTMEELQQKAEQYNVSNPGLWEDKLKLLTYAAFYRTDLLQKIGGLDEDFNPGSYDDDAICFTLRRMGYRIVLARDTFVHHYGNLTFKDEYAKDRSLSYRNRALFFQKFHADPYLAGLIDYNVVSLPSYSGKESVDILGIGSSYGMTILQMKNVCRTHGSKNISLYYLSDIAWTQTDLATICEKTAVGNDPVNFSSGRSYDYIVVEKEPGTINDLPRYFTALYGLLNVGGQIVCTADQPQTLYAILGTMYSLGAVLQNQQNYRYLCFSKQV